ncbi:SHOCT domain-containing protein [Billgrantia sp. LNSP4103-1]|uniref:SHOCT domain-containing protein n=1 Tax=Billgrantia sp. LNSP4103-1 TaxID=3410266 RepID=UPI00403EF7C0
MPSLSPQGTAIVDALAERHDFSRDAIAHMVAAVADGNGQMAMFSHPEFGGPGQWMQGGMLMLSDSLNHALKARVDALCHEIGEKMGENASGIIARQPAWLVAEENPAWWPAEFGAPNATGAQDGLRYAYFAQARRLVVQTADAIRVYDTLDHRISGFAQQQGNQSRFTVTSQHGDIDLASLPLIDTDRQPSS